MRKTYINCGNKYQELIALGAMLGLVKVKWTDHTELIGFSAFICIIMIVLAPLFMYGLGLLHIHPIVSFITIVGFWFIWNWNYFTRNIKTCEGYAEN